MDKKALKIKIAKLFYQNELSKIEIGRKLRISRFKVAYYLNEALNEGLVEINIIDDPDYSKDLENMIEKKFKIQQAKIVKTSASYEQTKKNIGKSAAVLLEDLVHNGDTIGVAWGTTLYGMLNNLSSNKRIRNISVVQLTGGLHQIEMDYSPVELTLRMAKIFRAKIFQLYVPAIVDNPRTSEILLSESNIKRTIEMFSSVSIALVGIGSVVPKPSTMLYRDDFINKIDVESIIKSKAVGDINSYFYDINGKECSTKLDNRTIGINLLQLKQIRYVMGVAGGLNKAEAIYGALKGGIVNIIVTDSETAEKILNMN